MRRKFKEDGFICSKNTKAPKADGKGSIGFGIRCMAGAPIKLTLGIRDKA